MIVIKEGIECFSKMVLIIFLSGFLFMSATFAQTIPKDSINNPEYIKKIITYNKVYPFINYNQNFIEWCNYGAIEPFFNKLKQTKTRKLSVLHIGDSHVQADFITGYLRNQFQKMFGNGGRGFVSAYAAAGTHSAYDYKTSCKGAWYFSRNIQIKPVFDMGITGATVHTQDSSASFKFIFYYNSIKSNFTHFKLYRQQSSQSFNLKLKASGQKDTIYIDCRTPNNLSYVEFDLAKASDTLEFFIDRTDTTQKYLECYGIMIESPDSCGVLYNSVGINGAGYKSIIKENLFGEELRELKPDLIILDLGGNDFGPGKIYIDDMKRDLSKIIDIIRKASPESCIIVGNSQDFYRRRKNMYECLPFSELTKEVAFSKNCAFYNYYNVSGNRYSMLYWYKNHLAQQDRVHLTNAGYMVKGELYLNAILNSYYESLVRDKKDTLLTSKIDTSKIHVASKYSDVNNINVVSNDVINRPSKDSIIKRIPIIIKTPANNYSPEITETNEKLYYKIKPGDNLGTIASKYHVSVTQLKQWNNIKGTNIVAGKTLIIYRKKYYTVNNNKTNNTENNNQNSNKVNQNHHVTNTNVSTGKKITHKVVKGDNLWDISRKYKVSIDQIKKLNNIGTKGIKIGQILTISN